MGNAVMSEETHGNTVAGAAAASAGAQPSVDTASLAPTSIIAPGMLLQDSHIILVLLSPPEYRGGGWQ